MTISNSVDTGLLDSYVERLREKEEARRLIVDDMKEILQEAVSSGFEGPAIKAVLRMVLMNEKQKEREKLKAETLGIYANALQIEMF